MYTKKSNKQRVDLNYLKLVYKNSSFPPNGPSDEWLEENGFVRFVQTLPPDAAHGEVVEEVEPSLKDGVYVQQWASRPMTDEELANFKSSLVSFLGAVRWEKETGGIELGGVTILTRDRDKTLINGKLTQVLLEQLPDSHTFKFTTDEQEFDMTVGQLKLVGVAIANHVQRTIDAAALVRPLIDNDEVVTENGVRVAYQQAFDSLS